MSDGKMQCSKTGVNQDKLVCIQTKKKKWMIVVKEHVTGCAAVLASLSLLSGQAEPANADLWIGLPGQEDGFLLNEATGEIWMTGQCLKQLAPAKRDGAQWVSRTSEFVSVGRMTAMLDQTFRLDISPDAPGIAVINPDRGGEQIFRDVVLLHCATGACRRFADIPGCAD